MEVKWKDLTSVKRIINDLKKKSKLVGLEGYKKYFGVVAKSAKRKDGLVFDLRDFNKVGSNAEVF